MAGQTTTVEMTGGGPWGFRLFGGEDDPLVVAKLRKRSKAHEAGLQEDDVILAINTYSCKGMSHSSAMGLSDKGDSLKLTVLRGTSDKNAVDAAFQNLGSEFQPLPASQMPQSSTTLQVDSSPRGQSTSPRASPGMWKVSDVHNRGWGGGDVKREEKRFKEGNQEKHVTTETSTQKFGGTTLTKITREEVSRTKFGDEAAPKPASDNKSLFQVSKVGGGAPLKPSTWSPAGGSTTVKTGGISVRAPGDVHVQQHPDQSVTMTIGMHKPEEEGKENVSPYHQPPMFKVPKISQGHEPSTAWKPSALKQQQPVFPPARPERASPQAEMELIPDGSGRWGRPGGADNVDSMDPELPKVPATKPNNFNNSFNRNNAPMPLMLTKILHEGVGSGSDDCSTPDTPTRRKKLFGDSAFYDDPDHKYPTIEEQIKMARKVALSLTAPANVQARGHRMFVKRQKKACKWTTGEAMEDMIDMLMNEEDMEEEEVYGHPDPWKIKWEPPKVVAPVRKMEIPNPPPLPTGVAWKAPNIPHVGTETAKALSADEFERMRLYDAKTEHTNIGPQACFALADALHHSKGKGGRLFAKRKERSETWVVDEENVRAPHKPPDAEMILKLTGGRPVGIPQSNATATGGAPVNRLKGMIELPKAAMTPWEAAVEDPGGNLEKAFSHLDGYFAAKNKARAASSLQGVVPQSKPDMFTPSAASATGSLSPSSTISSGPSRMPDYTRKIKPWGAPGAEASSPAGASSSPQSWSGHESSNVQPSTVPRSGAPWSQQPAASAPSSHQGDTNFRPVKFKPAPGVTRTGAWQPSSGAACPAPSGGEAAAGVCDL